MFLEKLFWNSTLSKKHRKILFSPQRGNNLHPGKDSSMTPSPHLSSLVKPTGRRHAYGAVKTKTQNELQEPSWW